MNIHIYIYIYTPIIYPSFTHHEYTSYIDVVSSHMKTCLAPPGAATGRAELPRIEPKMGEFNGSSWMEYFTFTTVTLW
jgi:hypothetical protein